jgi:hypothetical protein
MLRKALRRSMSVIAATEQFTTAAAIEPALLSGSWPSDRFQDSAFLMVRKPDQRQLR